MRAAAETCSVKFPLLELLFGPARSFMEVSPFWQGLIVDSVRAFALAAGQRPTVCGSLTCSQCPACNCGAGAGASTSWVTIFFAAVVGFLAGITVFLCIFQRQPSAPVTFSWPPSGVSAQEIDEGSLDLTSLARAQVKARRDASRR